MEKRLTQKQREELAAWRSGEIQWWIRAALIVGAIGGFYMLMWSTFGGGAA